MSRMRELQAAGIEGAALQGSYALCRRLNARHGKTFYLATVLLPKSKRPYVHALYGFARYADELVDDLRRPDPAALATWGATFLRDLDATDAFDIHDVGDGEELLVDDPVIERLQVHQIITRVGGLQGVEEDFSDGAEVGADLRLEAGGQFGLRQAFGYLLAVPVVIRFIVENQDQGGRTGA